MIYNNVILEISKKNLISNFNYFNKLNKYNICAVTIKSNAYGFGAKNVYDILLKKGCRHFFVATTTEGVYLRKFFKKGIIYILNGLENNNLKIFKYYKLIPIISNLDDYKKIINKSINFGIQINTGINRLGLNYIDYKKISYDNKYLKIVLSHLSSADERKNIYNNTQLTKFNKIVKKYKNNKVIFSLANSFGSVLSNKYLFDMIRPGIAIYGGHNNISKLTRF